MQKKSIRLTLLGGVNHVLRKLWCRIAGSKSKILPELWNSIENKHNIKTILRN